MSNSDINGRSSSYSTLPPSRRPDGSYREEIRVRSGYIPQAERQNYTPPAARQYSSYSSSSQPARASDSQESLEDRVDSWADEPAPVLAEKATVTHDSSSSAPEPKPIKPEASTKEAAASKLEVPSKENTVSSIESEVSSNEISTETATSQTPEPRKPSQLATAIDTALDGLSIGSTSASTEATASRPIGRFAAQIANDERGGEYRPYRRYDNYSRDNNSSSGGGYNNYNNNNYNNSNSNYRDNRSSWSRTCNSSEVVSGSSPSTGENRVENEFKTFLEELVTLRREMAVINAKLEYIRYIKARDVCDLSDVERVRLAMEPALVIRIDAIFEAIEALNVKP